MKKLVVLGAGESGVGAALLGKAKGYDVFVSDSGTITAGYRAELEKEEIPFEEGAHSADVILAADEIVKSPGIPDQAPVVRQAAARNIPVISEIEFGYRHIKGRFIAITGTNGKTTTTLLTYHLLKEAGLNAALTGNVGASLARKAVDDAHDYYVVEVSSFQLDGMYRFRADAAILLNITPDHLDRYDYKLENYVDSKFRIVQNMHDSDAFIYFGDDQILKNEIAKRPIEPQKIPVSLADSDAAAYLLGDELVFTKPEVWSVPVSGLPLRGRHNYVNVMTAVLAALHVNVKPAAVKEGLKTFRNAPHRMEPAGEIHGVQFINDSKATNVDAVYYALESFKNPVVWIAGGIDKGNDYGQLKELAAEKVKAIVCLGKDNAKIIAAFKNTVNNIEETDNIQKAVEMAYNYSRPGDTALLSPACASFDLFKNYMDRGDQFKAAVKNLIMKVENQEQSE